MYTPMDTPLFDVIAPAIGPLPPSPHEFYETISNGGVYTTYENEHTARYCLAWWLRMHPQCVAGEVIQTEHGWTTRGHTAPLEQASGIIMTIRLRAGGDPYRCCTCGHPRSAPYRSRHKGRIVEGCIDASHSGWVRGEDQAWHERPQAVAHREETARHLLESCS